MDQNQLLVTVGILLSVAFSWIPKLKEWYAALDNTLKRLVMLGALAVAALLVFGLSCTQFTIPGVTMTVSCDAQGAKELGQLFINALVANQIAFLAVPKPNKE